MDTTTLLSKILTNPTDDLRLFDNKELLHIYEKNKGAFYIKSLSKEQSERLVYHEVDGIKKKACPEEIVRQLYIKELITRYKYPRELIEIEKWVNFGREQKRADIVIYRKDGITPKILIEVKSPGESNDIQQLKSYLNAEGAPVGVAINGRVKLILFRPYPKEFDDTLDDIPAYDEEVQDVLQKRKTLKDLKEQDLKEIIKDLEELVIAGSGYDSFDEIFKLIYAKLFDEKEALIRPNQELWFRKSPTGSPDETKRNISDLFEKAKQEWPDIFEPTDKIRLNAEHLSVCIGEFQDVKLFGSNLRIIDEAFEYLLPDVAKGKKGQYFTPRVVIDMCVKMLNPRNREYVIDTACGSAGFLVHAMQHVWKSLPTQEAKKEYASRYLFGIDFDEKSAKISRAIMLVAGDGKSHIYKANTLDTREWPNSMKEDLQNLRLLKEFKDYTDTEANAETFDCLNFDVLLANPPFAGEIKQDYLLSHYDLGKNEKGKKQNTVERHILFVERNLDCVKSGGRLAIVLPQGIFNNSSEEYIRKYILKKARILAVVGLHANSFKPHTGTKTSIIFLQKWQANELDQGGNPTVQDYPIFFASSQQSFKDNSGDYIFERNEKGELVKDENGNPNYLTDLDEISEAFIEWGKEQQLNFII